MAGPTRRPLPLAQPDRGPRPERVVTTAPMLDYRCNQKGCCCRGWGIPFQLDDFIRLYDHLGEADRAVLGDGLRLLVDEAPPKEKADLLLRSLKLAGVGDDLHCRFLEGAGGCRVHAEHGIPALPDICVNFPAQGFRDEATGSVELYWDPVCPEVVRQLAEGTGAMELRELAPDSVAPEPLPGGLRQMGWHDGGFAQRVANARLPLRAHVGGVELSRAELEQVRHSSLRALGDLSRPTWQSLGAVLHGMRALRPGEAASFAADLPADLAPFEQHLGGCIGAHGAPLLFWSLRKMERFVHAVDLKPLFDEPHALLAALERWGDSLDARLFPHEEALRPIYARYLQHRFAMPYVNQEGELREAADTIALLFGCALRYAGGIAEALGRPVDSGIAQAGISASEYLYRSVRFGSDALPWFASADAN